jgi:putative nucleotidyltransferase with HDIG domain
LALAGDERTGAAQISGIIKLDPTLTAEMLRVANSALFGVRREITSVVSAVTLLGLDRVKAMATLVAVNAMVKPAMRIAALRKFWVHSLVTAFLAEEFGAGAGLPRELAYTAGLLHNLGTLGLMAAYPEEYARMIEVTDHFGFDMLKTERDLFEIDHCAAGAYLAQEWNFPDEIAAVLASHHDEPVPGETSLYNVVRVSWRMADTLGYEAFPQAKAWDFDQLLGMVPGAGRTCFGAGPEEARAAVAARVASFAG